MKVSRWVVCLLAVAPTLLHAQMSMSAKTLIEAEEQHGSSGTSIEPASTSVPMMMTDRNGWRLMLHGNGFAANTQQQANSPRNRDAFFSTNWIMPMAQHKLGAGVLTVRTMLSLEPATVGRRNFPELFQQGETAYGTPIVDGQHPHDFFMEVAALYDLPLGKNALLSLYAAPVGDPAVGPTAYPHRQSASEDPIAALGHHQEDSTHIAFNVVTGGFTYKWVRAELSGFHGGEPDEHRWAFQPSPNGHNIDSAAGRLTVSPTADWTAQYSAAHIHSPEALYPGEDQQRQTASVMYHHTFSRQSMKMDGMSRMDMASMPGMSSGAKDLPAMSMEAEPRTDLSATAVWGRTKSLADQSKENSYLLEALLHFAAKNYIWTRMENAGRSNELLLTPGQALPAGFAESPIGHVAAYSFGYDRDFALGPHVLAAPGAQFTLYRTPQVLQAAYGTTPTGEVLFVRFRLR
ncbi:hypothetical protein GOB94_07190 [Granulicella sp. 5B5]|uniref:hypothetical protein n=1 Tax=Granulicella sp. 5B5 TaxID=1617967 RepID=UPI0015F714C2|nr:hypothetical protein [Granulicella sp. 5B5]QMV18494.1 hypothetical protein GOB94_07190 [Granulicella sp. 5B5]